MINSIGLAQFDFERREVPGNLFNSSADLIPGVFEPPFGILGIIRHALDSAVESFDPDAQHRQFLNQIQQRSSGTRTSYIVHWNCSKGLDDVIRSRLLIFSKSTETVIRLCIKDPSNAFGIVPRYQADGEECRFFSIMFAVLNSRRGTEGMLSLSLTQNVRSEKRCNCSNRLNPGCGFGRGQSFFRIFKYRAQCNDHKCKENNNKKRKVPSREFLLPSGNHLFSGVHLAEMSHAAMYCQKAILS